MNILNNLKTSAKLYVSFGMMIVFLFIIVGAGYIGMLNINTDMTNLYFDRTLPVRDVGMANAALYKLRGDLYNYVYISDSRTKTKEDINVDQEIIKEAMDKYRATYLGEKEKAMLAEFDTTYSAYQSAVEFVIANCDDGKEILVIPSLLEGGGVFNARKAVDAVMNEIVELNISLAEELNAKGNVTFASSRNMLLATGFSAILLGIVSGFVISRSIATPLEMVTKMAQALSIGDLMRGMSDQEKDRVRLRKDEIGMVGKAFDQLIGYMQEMGIAATAIANNDLTTSVIPNSEKDELGNAFRSMVDNLQNLVGVVAESANSLGAASGQLAAAANQAGQATAQISTTIQQVAKGTALQSESVNRTATSVEQLSRAIDGVARGAQDQTRSVNKAAQITGQITNVIQQVAINAQAGAKGSDMAAVVAEGGVQTVSATIQGMQTIQTKVNLSAQKVQQMGARSEQIGLIVDTIEDIASQTNLLALNAAIEAARVESQGEKTVENILQQHMLGVVSLVADILTSGRELRSDDLVRLAHEARLDVISISDRDGVIVASSDPSSLGFRFSEDPHQQSSIFRPLLSQCDGVSFQPIVARDQDGKLYLYVGVSRRDQPGVVEAGTRADIVYRLGGYSRGFAVVAEEVWKLAERAGTATKEIGGLVKDIQRAVSEAMAAMNDGSNEVAHGVQQANQAGQALEEILKAAKEVNRQVAQIATATDEMSSLSNELVAATDAVSAVVEENTAATEEMAAGSSGMTRAIENIASVSQENSAAVEEVCTSAEEMSAQVEEVTASAQSLAEMAQALQQVVSQFKLADKQYMNQRMEQVTEPVLNQARVMLATQGSNSHSRVKGTKEDRETVWVPQPKEIKRCK